MKPAKCKICKQPFEKRTSLHQLCSGKCAIKNMKKEKRKAKKLSKIRKSAQGENCTVRIIGYCNGNSETVVLAHLNGIRYGKGTGHKVNDLHGAYCCSGCHDALDGRVRTNHSRQELELWHLQGVIETQVKLIEKGLM